MCECENVNCDDTLDEPIVIVNKSVHKKKKCI